MALDGHSDAVNHPAHYTSRSMECIELVEMLPFCEGNAIKYLWRAGLKGPALEDLRKALWYVARAADADNALKVYRPRLFRWSLQRALEEFSDERTRNAIKAIAERRLTFARALLEHMIASASGVPSNTSSMTGCIAAVS